MKQLSSLLWLKAAVLILLSLLPGFVADAQVPTWQSAITIDSNNPGNSEVVASAADANGNVFIIGGFIGTVAIGTTTVTSTATNHEIFIAKWSSATNSFVMVRMKIRRVPSPFQALPSTLRVGWVA